MKKIFKQSMLLFALLCGVAFINAQNSNFLWRTVSESSVSTDRWEVSSTPLNYTTYNLDIDAFFNQIENAPDRSLARTTPGIIVSFPDINGEPENYEIYDASVLADELQQDVPDIRSFVGKSLREKNKVIRFSISLFGLKGIILNADDGVQYIDCITKDRQSYIMYLKKDISPEEGQLICHVDDSFTDPVFDRNSNSTWENRNAVDGRLREFRLALTCTREVTTFYVNQAGLGGANDTIKKTVMLAALNGIMTRVNAVYEVEMGLTMVIVADNRDIIFTSENDNLTNNSLGLLLDENQAVIDANIGVANYDIGHVICTASGGLAQLFSPCTSNKSRAASGTFTGQPTGFQFEGIIMHEMGHQYGAFHTWSAPSCSGTYTDFSAVEPGSGTTIMSYAGICGSAANIQALTDIYFHQNSIDEMWGNITAGNSTCAQQIVTNNAPPTADAGPNYTIPRGTPYKLTGIGTDDSGEAALTYTWDQMDANGPEALPTNTTVAGPVVRSFPPSSSNVRYVPRLADYVNQVNNSTQWEKLVLVQRNLNFAFTVRDNDPSGGQSNADFMTIAVRADTDAFRVTSQDLINTVYLGNSVQTVTWNPANTAAAPINAANVNILLSTDGGLTFDTVLLANTPNDGSQEVTMPNVNSTTCRIMVEAADNIFFNINVRNFEIEEVLGVDDQILNNDVSIYPNPNKGEFNIKLTSVLNKPITVKVYDIRGRVIFQNAFVQTPEFNETIKLNQVQSGVYLLGISSGESSITRKIIIN